MTMSGSSIMSPTSEIMGGACIVGAPKDMDVVFGRGGFANRHEGNKRYLELIGKHEKEYLVCQRKYQKLISLCIIHQLRSKGTRFLKKDEKSGTWKTVKLSLCRLKISQRLRERAPFIKLEQVQAMAAAGVTNAVLPMNRQLVKKVSPVGASVQANVINVSSDDDEVSCAFHHEASDDESMSPLPPFHDIDDSTLAPLKSMFENIFGYDPLSRERLGELEDVDMSAGAMSGSEKRLYNITNDSVHQTINKRRKISFDQHEISQTGYGYGCGETSLQDKDGLDDVSVISDLSCSAVAAELDNFELHDDDDDDDDLDQMIEAMNKSSDDDGLFEYLEVLFHDE